ncbi:GFA family protein [Phenylobacterium sp. J367]|uniref:GFA family protein n=1 Tax=Phenylobacterium sp. J367 TaxID=2898435 RepID=UPI0021517397|nr:GFA family protein [Phenylobacterium sp. J367]MCR5880332.1 GFA family protein [Phenylobacterium sp. J367]
MRGSCHCGGVAYTLDETPTEAIECNCSICRRRGSILAFVKPEVFHLETSRDGLTVYTWNKHAIRHQFCSTCGCAPFAEGQGRGGPMVAINLRCAEDLDLATVKVTPFDGAHRIPGPAD